MSSQITIVIPAFNAERFLSAAIESVLSQTFRHWELIVVDDGSRDGTADLALGYAQSDARIRVIRQSNHGLSLARNAGLLASHEVCPYIIFLDADDVWEPDALAVLLQALQADGAAAAAYGMGRFLDVQGRPIKIGELEGWLDERQAWTPSGYVSLTRDEPTTFDVLVVRNCIANGTVLIRRGALEASGLFDPMRGLRRASGEDWDLWLRMSLQGHFRPVQQVVLGYRRHDHNMSSDRRQMLMGDGYIRCKLIRNPGLSSTQRQSAERENCVMLTALRRPICGRNRRLAFRCWRLAARRAGLGHASQSLRLVRRGIGCYIAYLKLRHFASVTTILGLEDQFLPRELRRSVSPHL